jgi:hypothetical protein
MLLTCLLVFTQQSQASLITTQTTIPASSDFSSNGYNGSDPSYFILGSLALPTDTNLISNLTSSVTLIDQGWGGQSSSNGVMIGLVVDDVRVWGQRVAGADHSWGTDLFDINSDPLSLASLNSSISVIDWNSVSDVKFNMFTTALGYGGWELHVRDASFSVTSEVPEPSTLAIFALGMIGLASRRFKKQS